MFDQLAMNRVLVALVVVWFLTMRCCEGVALALQVSQLHHPVITGWIVWLYFASILAVVIRWSKVPHEGLIYWHLMLEVLLLPATWVFSTELKLTDIMIELAPDPHLRRLLTLLVALALQAAISYSGAAVISWAKRDPRGDTLV